jgi:peptidoglycan/xylan/chitin deacetylase (PgdA/CDA1 family)
MPQRGALYYRMADRAGLVGLSRRVRDAASILCYHNVVPRGTSVGEPGLHLDADAFERQIRWLAQHYTCIPLAELAWRIRHSIPLRRRVVVTFDDAYAGVFEQALPILKRYCVPATVFVVTSGATSGEPFAWDRAAAAGAELPASHRPATWDTIAAAARDHLVSIGVHTQTHPSLPDLPDRLLTVELREAREILWQRIGVAPTFAAYPYGRWSARVRAAARAAGYDGALTLQYGTVTVDDDPWSLRRINVPAGLPPDTFPAWVAGFRPSHRIA